jgi:hypothetical protein
MDHKHFKTILFLAFAALTLPGCAATRSENASTKTFRDRMSTAVGETAVFASETVPMAVLSPVLGVPENQKELKWYQRRLP